VKPIHFAPISFILAGMLAFGQTNEPGKPPVPNTNFRSTAIAAPQGSKKTPMLTPSGRPPAPATTFGFANAVTYDSGGFSAAAVSAVDLNGDGKPDLVIANACGDNSTCLSTNGSVAVLLNNGNGTFGTAVTYDSNGWLPSSVAVADVNGDGKPDIVVANQCATPPGSPDICSTQGSLAVLLGNGDGTFQSAVSYGSGGFYAGSVAIADVNGDGKPDLVLVNVSGSTSNDTGDGTVAVLLGNGDGTFQAAVTYDTGALESKAVAVADLRGDGKLDLVVANFCAAGTCDNVGDQAGSVSVLLGNGDGTFQTPAIYSTDDLGTDAVAVADVNGDGKLDIAVSSYCSVPDTVDCLGEGAVAVFLGNGDGTFQGSTQWRTQSTGTGSVLVTDVNGDGKPDLEVSVACATEPLDCSGATNPPGVSGAGVLLGNGDGTFQPAQYFGSTGYLLYGSTALAVADVDGDGRPDLIVASSCTGTGCTTGSPEHSIVGVMINTSTFPNSGPTTTTLTSSSNPSNVDQSVTFTAAVSSSGSGGTPGGPATLLDGSTSLGIFPLNSSGVATATIASLVAGTHNITATYNGGADFSSSASAALSQVVQGQDFSLTPSSPTATVMSGQTATYTVSVSPLGGFNQSVTLSCSGAPTSSICSLSSSSVALGGSTSTSVKVSVTTSGSSASLAHPAFSPIGRSKIAFWLPLSGLPGIALVGIWRGRSRNRRGRILHIFAVLCLLSVGVNISACGSSGSSNKGGGTPAGTYNLTVTGSFTSGSTNLNHMAKLTLVVQ
jgi:Bacterial Ig-like domain (group 3)/FG-GAP-like repeat